MCVATTNHRRREKRAAWGAGASARASYTSQEDIGPDDVLGSADDGLSRVQQRVCVLAVREEQATASDGRDSHRR